MQKSDSYVVLSPTDLANHLACSHLSYLNYKSLFGGAKPSKDQDELAEILQQYGSEHESRYFETLRLQLEAIGRTITDLDAERDMSAPYSLDSLKERAQLTKQRLHDGPNALYQPTFFNQDSAIGWVGRADFLVATDMASKLGDYSFEPEDTKLARIAKVNAVLQLCSYAEHLTNLQGVAPEFIHVVTGSPKEGIDGKVSIRLSEVSAYFRHVKATLQLAVLNNFDEPSEPVPVDACTVCNWSKDCNRWWRERDHLSFVAGLTNSHREVFVANGITTLAQLATSPDTLTISELETETLSRLRRQAQLQYKTRVNREANAEAIPEKEFILPIREYRGFNLLAEANPGDLFYDIEGHPYRGDEGLEYLHGFAWKEQNGTLKYQEIWAHTPDKERQALIDVIAFINERRAVRGFENMRVYHFGHYEPSALRRLATRYATEETALQALLRERVFVDLSRVVMQAMRIGVESYSIKKLEQMYDFDRTDLVADGGLSIVYYERWLQSINNNGLGSHGDVAVLRSLAEYNMNDCYSTIKLRDWLEAQLLLLREQIAQSPEELSRLTRPQLRLAAEDETIGTGLVAQLNIDRFNPDLKEDQVLALQHRWLMADLLDFHKREQAVDTWEFLTFLSMENDELYDSPSAIAGLQFVRETSTDVTRSKKHGFKAVREYRFDPTQITKMSAGATVDSSTFWPFREGIEDAGPVGSATVSSIDLDNGIVELDLRYESEEIPNPQAVFAKEFFSKAQFESGLQELAGAVLADNSTLFSAAQQILALRPPRFVSNFDLRSVSENTELSVTDIAEAIHHLDRSYLVIQGPPGTGKTYSSANAILALVNKGHRIGITSNTHAAAHQLLGEIIKFAASCGYTADKPLRVAVKPKDRDINVGPIGPEVALTVVTDTKKIAAGVAKFDIIVGTSFLFSNVAMRDSVDTLIIDEAGQLSLADSLAVALSARNTVLVGDPQQLKQPTRAAHPGTSGLSGLEHINQGHDVVPSTYGILLPITRRMHPTIAAFISEQVYEGKLTADGPCALQSVGPGGLVSGSGLRWVPVEHDGCSVRSPQEVREVVKIYESVLGRDFTDKFGAVRPITPRDIFVIAPYNAQVQELRRKLLEIKGAAKLGISDAVLQQRVGTVDKAQGSEAPIVLVSYTSSSAEDIPRNFEFLYSKNRFNVAVSRAQALTVVVASPHLLNVNCKTITQIKLANMLCRYVELAGT